MDDSLNNDFACPAAGEAADLSAWVRHEWAPCTTPREVDFEFETHSVEHAVLDPANAQIFEIDTCESMLVSPAIPPSPVLKSKDIDHFVNVTQSLSRSQLSSIQDVVGRWQDVRETVIKTFTDGQRAGDHQSTWHFVANVFDGFLRDAQQHRGIARKGKPGSREWFRDWRRAAVAAIRAGLEAVHVIERVRVQWRTRGAVRWIPVLSFDDAGGEVSRTRLVHSIFPNAPGASGSRNFDSPEAA